MSTWTGSRPDIDEYFLGMSSLVSSRATCARRKVGCVLVDSFDHVLATGYNGVASGEPHCNERGETYYESGHGGDYPVTPLLHPCPGASQPSGEGLHLCQAIHAEQNALLQCRSPESVTTVYSTASPCIQCMRLLVNLPNLKRVVFSEEYPHVESRELAERRGIDWHHYGAG